MDTSNPYGEDKPKKEKEEKTPPKKKKSEDSEDVANIYESLTDPDYDEEDEEESESLDDSDDEFEEDEVPWFKNPKILAIGGVAFIVLALIVYFVFIKKDPPPPPPVEVEEEYIDSNLVMKGELYKIGIGKDAIDEKNIFEQGNIESNDFRKDFVNTDSTESYVLPIQIVAVNDSVSYSKHRTMTDDGMDMYWVDAVYKSKKTRFTVPYYIWQTLAPQGVMDVIAEVVTDAEGKTFVTSLTAVPPTGGK